MNSKTVIGVYGQSCFCFDRIETNLSQLIDSQYVRIEKYPNEDIQPCDIYIVSMQPYNAVDVIKRIREESKDAIIIICCYNSSSIETLKQVVKYRVNSIYEPEEIDAITETILSNIEHKTKENILRNRLRRSLKKTESALTQMKKVKRDLDEPDLANTAMMISFT